MTITIFAVGDIMLGEHHLSYKSGVSSFLENKGYKHLFDNVSKILSQGDIVIGNLEAPVSNKTQKQKPESDFFRCSPIILKSLKECNFNVFSIANNHIMEHGKKGFFSTIENLKKVGILPVGIRQKAEILEFGDYKIGFLGYSFVEDNIKNPIYNRVKNDEEIKKEIKNIKDKVDLIILLLHWGKEFIPLPSPKQVKYGRNLIKSGADIIVGSHPHVLQGFEFYKGKPIFYSLGNFVFDQTYIKLTRLSVIVKIVVDLRKKKFEVQNIPVITGEKDFTPRIAKDIQENKILNLMNSVRLKIEGKRNSDYLSERQYSLLSKKYNLLSKLDIRFQQFRKLTQSTADYRKFLIKRYLKKKRF